MCSNGKEPSLLAFTESDNTARAQQRAALKEKDALKKEMMRQMYVIQWLKKRCQNKAKT